MIILKSIDWVYNRIILIKLIKKFNQLKKYTKYYNEILNIYTK